MPLRVSLGFWVCLVVSIADASEIKVAVAANFKPVLEQLAQQFSEKEKDRVVITSAASGVIYNQLIHGAPYDLFLSADSQRPEMLEANKLAVPDSRKPYAYGRLVLWDRSGKVNKLSDLKNWKGKLAIANPATAPYGLAAQQVLKKAGLWESFASRVVQGANIQQTWLFLNSGNARVGLVARSQLVGRKDQSGVSLIPEADYTPIRQEMVILRASQQLALARKFADFLLSPDSQEYIVRHGYKSASGLRGGG